MQGRIWLVDGAGAVCVVADGRIAVPRAGAPEAMACARSNSALPLSACAAVAEALIVDMACRMVV